MIKRTRRDPGEAVGRFWKTAWPWFPVAWFVVLLVCGFFQLRSYTGSWTEGLYFSVTQFLGAFPTPPDEGAEVGLKLQVVRLLAALTGLGTLLFAAYLLAYREWGWSRARGAKGHIVVIGTGEPPFRLATALRKGKPEKEEKEESPTDRARRRRVWLVDTNPETPPPRPLDKPKRLPLDSRPKLDGLLRNAAEVYILEPDASQALRLLTAAVYAEGASSSEPRKVFLVTDDSDLASEFLGWEPGESAEGAVTVDVIDALARLMDRKVMPSEPLRSTESMVPSPPGSELMSVRDILIVGEGERARVAARFAADGFSIVDSVPICVVGQDAEGMIGSFREKRPDVRATWRAISDDLTDLVPTVQGLLDERSSGIGRQEATMVVVTGRSDDASVVRTSAIARSLNRSTVLLRCVIDGPSPNEEPGPSPADKPVRPLIGTEGALVFSIEDNVADPRFYEHTTADAITAHLRSEILQLDYTGPDLKARLRSRDELDPKNLASVAMQKGWRPEEVDLGKVRSAIGMLGYQFAAGEPPAVLTPQELVVLEGKLLPSLPDGPHDIKRFERLRWVNAIPVALARTGVGLIRVRPTQPWLPELDGSAMDRMATAIHDTYTRHIEGSGSGACVGGWNELSYSDQIANYSQAHSYSVVLAFLGLGLLPAPRYPTALNVDSTGAEHDTRLREMWELQRRNLRRARDDAGDASSDDDDWAQAVAFLSRMEHDRWCRARLAAGWEHGDTKDPAARTHPDLIHWDRLPPHKQRIDEDFVLGMTTAIAAAGLQIVPRSVVDALVSAKPVRPAPVVRAESPADGWFEDGSGGRLKGLPGSVWVRGASSPEEAAWPVAAGLFVREFEPVGTNAAGLEMYQRSHVYEAKVTTALAIPTVEGVTEVPAGGCIRVGSRGDLWSPKPGRSAEPVADERS